MDSRNVSKEFITEFLELYRSFPCLWKIKSKDYSDRDKKRCAYEALVDKFKEVQEDVTKETVVKKIDSFRGSFRKELKKLEASKKSGAGTTDLYKPKLWYFYNLYFLIDQETPRTSILNINDIIVSILVKIFY